MRELLAPFGGHLSASSDRHLLIKPNFLSPDPPERASTTHPAVLLALHNILTARNPEQQIVLGDSPALASCRQVWERGHYAEYFHSCTPAPHLVDLGQDPSWGHLQQGPLSPPVSATALKASLLVNVPKLKTHGFTGMTASLKNLFGCIPGRHKARCHLSFPHLTHFGRLLWDLWSLLPPSLHVVDAIVAMEGQGPRNGTPCSMGYLIAGCSPAAVDLTCAHLLGMPQSVVPYLDPEQIPSGHPRSWTEVRLRGSLPDLTRTVFQVRQSRPSDLESTRHFPLRLRPWILPRPRVAKRNCTRCGQCLEICPSRPRSLTRTRKGYPVWHPRTCLYCFCCQEICPHGAMTRKEPMAARILGLLKKDTVPPTTRHR